MSWKDKIKPGYFYRLTGTITMDTGYQGVKDFCKYLEDLGYPEDFIEDKISVFKDNKWQPIKDVVL